MRLQYFRLIIFIRSNAIVDLAPVQYGGQMLTVPHRTSGFVFRCQTTEKMSQTNRVLLIGFVFATQTYGLIEGKSNAEKSSWTRGRTGVGIHLRIRVRTAEHVSAIDGYSNRFISVAPKTVQLSVATSADPFAKEDPRSFRMTTSVIFPSLQ